MVVVIATFPTVMAKLCPPDAVLASTPDSRRGWCRKRHTSWRPSRDEAAGTAPGGIATRFTDARKKISASSEKKVAASPEKKLPPPRRKKSAAALRKKA